MNEESAYHPPFIVQENTSGKSGFNNHSDTYIYIYIKWRENYNKKSPLIKWNCHSGIRASCLSAYSQNKHLKTRPRWCHFLTGKAYWVIPRHLDSYIMFKLFHGWMAAVAWKKILMSGINRKRDRGLQSQTRKRECQVSAALIVRENLRKQGSTVWFFSPSLSASLSGMWHLN